MKTYFFRPGKKHFIFILLFSLLYALWTGMIVGFRADHAFFLILIIFLVIFHRQTRYFFYCFIFFAIFWILYDSLRVYPNYSFGDVHIEPPYNLEKLLFGIPSGDEILTLNEYFRINSNKFLDIISGLFYLTWVPIPMLLAFYFFLTDKKHLLRYSGAYLFTNIIGFIIYYSYPAAPPWYFDRYGTELILNLPGDPALLNRFDHWIGWPLFTDMYTKNSNIFAAIPSLHAAYPVVALYYAGIKKMKWTSTLLAFNVLGIWFAAVYTFHHYLIDILIGLGCALLAILIYEKWLYPKLLTHWYDKYLQFVLKE